MTTAINDIDRLLQAAPVRVIHLGQAQVIVTAAPPLFHLLADGMPEYPEIELEATVIGLTGEVVWTCSGGTLSEVNGATAKLRYVDLVAGAATVVASVTYAGEEIIGRASISVVRDGSASAGAKLLELNPSEQVFKINAAGEHSPAAISLTAIGQNLAGTPRFTFASGSGTLAAGATSSQKVLSFDNMVTDTVTIQVEQDGQVDRVTISKLRDGGNGAAGITALLTNETVALPASSAGAVSSLTTAVCTMKVYRGTVDDTDNWSFSFSPASNAANVAYTTDKSTVTVTGMGAGVDAAFIDIKASRDGAAPIRKRFSLTKSKAGAKGEEGTGLQGQRGTVNIPVAITGVAWSDGAAAAGLTNGGYGLPIRFDLVTLVNTAAGYIETKVWDGDTWEDPGLILNGNLTAPGSILTRALAAEAVTAEKINSRGLDIKDRAGNVIFSSGIPLAQQVASNPNLAPNCMGLTVFNGASKNRNGDARFGDGQFLWLPETQTNGLYVAGETGALNIPRGAQYTVSFDANCTLAGSQRRLWVDLVGDGIDTAGLGIIPTTTMTRHKFTETMPDLPGATGVRLRVFSTEAWGGHICIANIKVELGGKETPWNDSVITPENASTFILAAAIKLAMIDKASIGQLSALSAYLGTVELGPNGWLRQGMTDYKVGKGIWMGMHGGVPKLVVGDPNSGMLEWDGNQLILQKAKEVSPFRGTLPSIDRRSQVNTSTLVTYATLTPTLFDGASPYQSYRWSMNAEVGPSGEVVMAGDPRGGSITIKGRGSNLVNVVWVSLEVVDANGAVARMGCQIYWQHGSGQIQ